MADEKQKVTEKKEPKFFEYGDVMFECNRCGNYEMLQRGIKDGMQFVLPTSDQHEWRLVCGKCGNMMRIFFKESTPETISEVKEAEKKKAEEEALEKAKKENESKKENKKEGSEPGGVEDSTRADELDGKGEPVATTSDEG